MSVTPLFGQDFTKLVDEICGLTFGLKLLILSAYMELTLCTQLLEYSHRLYKSIVSHVHIVYVLVVVYSFYSCIDSIKEH